MEGYGELLSGLRMFLISALAAIISFSRKAQAFVFTVLFQNTYIVSAYEFGLWPEREVVSRTGSTTNEL